MRLPILLPLAATLLLSACGGVSRHCTGEFEYQRAETLPMPSEADGLKMPESASALRIPPATDEPVPFAREYPDPDKPGKKRVDCLDIPPALREPPPPPEPASAD